jgi:LacI family transcriptional regulator
MSVTLKDIARLAGVSVGTASKVINREGYVSDDLRLRVEAVVEKLHYRPSALARSIKRKKTSMIGLLIPKIKNAFYIQVIDYIEKLVNQKGYTLFLGNTDEDLDTEIRYLRTLANMRVDGLLLATSGRKNEDILIRELRGFSPLGIPVTLIVRRLDQVLFDTIVLDNFKGAYEATRYAVSMGHRRIAIISSPVHTSASSERIGGYLKALEEAGLPYDGKLIHAGEATPQSGYEITGRLLDLPKPPTLIFVASNFPLLGVLRALRERNLHIPDRISLICFDDPEWSAYLDPPLTVVQTTVEDLCGKAVNFLFDRIEGSYKDGPRISTISTSLLVRSSVADISHAP